MNTVKNTFICTDTFILGSDSFHTRKFVFLKPLLLIKAMVCFV